MLFLTESFYSIQGEGKFAGTPAIFFRFAGCNLSCPGFGVKIKSPKTGETLEGCDTIRAVKFNHFKQNKITATNELMAIFYKLLPKCKIKPIVVITGGEPLIHHKNQIFYSFITEILNLDFQIHFETNGTIFVNFNNFPRYRDCIFAISIKLSNSAEPYKKRLNFNALKNIKDNVKLFFYKFVISYENNILKQLESEIEEIIKIVDGEIFCMPIGKNIKELEKNSIACLEFCLKKGYNYTDRLHIRIFNDKDGV